MARLKNRSSEGLTFWRILETLTLLLALPLSCSLVDISTRRDHRSILLRTLRFSCRGWRPELSAGSVFVSSLLSLGFVCNFFASTKSRDARNQSAAHAKTRREAVAIDRARDN